MFSVSRHFHDYPEIELLVSRHFHDYPKIELLVSRQFHDYPEIELLVSRQLHDYPETDCVPFTLYKSRNSHAKPKKLWHSGAHLFKAFSIKF